MPPPPPAPSRQARAASPSEGRGPRTPRPHRELEVVGYSYSQRAQRRIARQASRALRGRSTPLVIEDAECVDVEAESGPADADADGGAVAAADEDVEEDATEGWASGWGEWGDIFGAGESVDLEGMHEAGMTDLEDDGEEAEIDADHSHWDIGDFGSALQDHEDNIFGLVNPSVDVEDDGDDHIEIPDDDGVDVDGEGWGADVVWGIPGEDDGPEPPDHWPFVGDGMGIPRSGADSIEDDGFGHLYQTGFSSSSSSSSSAAPRRDFGMGGHNLPPILAFGDDDDEGADGSSAWTWSGARTALESVLRSDRRQRPLWSRSPVSGATERLRPPPPSPFEVAFFVEHVRQGMQPTVCRSCREPFLVGQLRLGYTPCGATREGRPFPPVWIHALRCARKAGLCPQGFGGAPSWSVDPEVPHDRPAVCFCSQVPRECRRRVLDELRRLPGQGVPPVGRRLCVRPWRYLPAELQHWAVATIPAPPVPNPPPLTPPAAGTPEIGASGRRHRGAFVEETSSGVVPFDDLPVEMQSADGARVSASRLQIGEDLGSPEVEGVLAQLLTELAAATRSAAAAVAFAGASAAGEAAAGRADAGSAQVEGLLRAIPVIRLDRRVEEPCIVCREPMCPNDECRRLPCLHLFHKECIDRWLCVKCTCPLDNMRLEDMLSAQRQIEPAEPLEPRSPSLRSRSPRRRRRSPVPARGD